MRWRLPLEEYNPELIHIQGSKSISADALSRLDIVDTNNLIKSNISSLGEQFSLEKEGISHPVDYNSIMQYQQNIKPLFETAKSNKDYSIKYFHVPGKKSSFICRQNCDP